MRAGAPRACLAPSAEDFPHDGNRYEPVDGELLVTPAQRQRHQRILGRLYVHLEAYVAARPDLAVAFFSPADIIWGPQEYVQPDLFVVPAHEVTGNWRDCRTLLLAVEIVSPSSARADRTAKRRLYQRRGVETYWIVDPDAALVEVWHPGHDRPEIATELVRWRVAPDADELVIGAAGTVRGPAATGIIRRRLPAIGPSSRTDTPSA